MGNCPAVFLLYIHAHTKDHHKWYKQTPTTCLTHIYVKGLSQIIPGARTASKNYYLSHIILLTVRVPGTICESPLRVGV